MLTPVRAWLRVILQGVFDGRLNFWLTHEPRNSPTRSAPIAQVGVGTPLAGCSLRANRETLGCLVGHREFDDAGIRGPPAALLQILVNSLQGEAQLAFACRILPDSTYMNSSSRSGGSLCIGHRCER